MTYDLLKIDDEPLLDIMVAAREGAAMLCVHAENHGIISWSAAPAARESWRRRCAPVCQGRDVAQGRKGNFPVR